MGNEECQELDNEKQTQCSRPRSSRPTDSLTLITKAFKITVRSFLVRHKKALCLCWCQHFQLYGQVIIICFIQIDITSCAPQRIQLGNLPPCLYTIQPTFSHLELHFLSPCFLYLSTGPSEYIVYYFPI